MTHRILFVVVTAFFVTMNVLLWRSEFRAEGELGSSVPVELVAKRMLTSPDNSNLDIFYNGKRTGFARWSANIGEDFTTGRRMQNDPQLEGEIKELGSYRLDCDGEFRAMSPTNRFRFYIGAEFDTNMNWTSFSVRLLKRPHAWEIRGDSELETVTLSHSAGGGGVSFEKEFQFAELQDPAKLFEGLGLPFAGQLLSGIAIGGARPDVAELASRIEWQANNDHLKFHGAKARVYRLTIRLFEDRELSLVVSRVGEILRLELPYGVSLINEELTR